jgi:hypothetical protein
VAFPLCTKESLLPRPRSASDLQIVTIRVYADDIARCNRFYPGRGHNPVFREILKQHFDQLERKLEAKRPLRLPTPEGDPE